MLENQQKEETGIEVVADCKEQLSLMQDTKKDKKTEEIKGNEKEDVPKKTKTKKPKEVEVRYTGVVTYCNGLQQSPLNLDNAFNTNEDYKKNNGATKAMIRKLALNGIVELKNPSVDIEIIEVEGLGNCFFLTNNLSKKGISEYEHIPFQIIEDYFCNVYHKEKAEARVLVYYNSKTKKFIIDSPKTIDKSSVSISNVISYCLDKDVSKYLVCDFHSHHIMSNTFSVTDDEDEKERANIFFGCFSFYGGWNLRYWDVQSQEFKTIEQCSNDTLIELMHDLKMIQ